RRWKLRCRRQTENPGAQVSEPPAADRAGDRLAFSRPERKELKNGVERLKGSAPCRPCHSRRVGSFFTGIGFFANSFLPGKDDHSSAIYAGRRYFGHDDAGDRATLEEAYSRGANRKVGVSAGGGGDKGAQA